MTYVNTNHMLCTCGHQRGQHEYPCLDCAECECPEFTQRGEKHSYAPRKRFANRNVDRFYELTRSREKER